MKSLNWNKTHTVLSCIVLGITILVFILEKIGTINFFKESPAHSIKIKGYVYKGSQKEPCKGCIVIIKQIQNITPPKSVDGNGFYISDYLKREELAISDNILDCNIQIKIGGTIVEETTKRINFIANETEFSFGDIIIPETTKNNSDSLTQPKYKIDVKDNKGIINQGDKIDIKEINN